MNPAGSSNPVRNALLSLLPTRPAARGRVVPWPSKQQQPVHSFHSWRKTTTMPPAGKKLGEGRPAPAYPPYPYGPRLGYKEADEGLYGGAKRQTGNKISPGRNKGKTKRRWHPNVRIEDLRSEALDTTLAIKVTASCMRTIRKCGGLDSYLLGDKPARIKELGLFGWQLRWRVLNTAKVREAMNQQRQSLGLPAHPPPMAQSSKFDVVWRADEKLRSEILAEQERQWQMVREKDEKFQQLVKTRWDDKYEIDSVVPTFEPQLLREIR